MWYCIKDVNETRTLSTGRTTLISVIINDRGLTGRLKLYDATSADDNNMIADIDINNCDNLLQYLESSGELINGLTYKTTGNPGNITILYR
jgi:hypothetical protein